MTLTPQQIALQIAEKIRELATRQGNVPFLTGDLRKSHVVQPRGVDGAEVGSNLPYARAVHDGRPQIIIRPKKGKRLFWRGPDGWVSAKQVTQPARKGNPWLLRAVETLSQEGVDWLAPKVEHGVAKALSAALRAKGFKVTRG